jgi:hypothetical protein
VFTFNSGSTTVYYWGYLKHGYDDLEVFERIQKDGFIAMFMDWERREF